MDHIFNCVTHGSIRNFDIEAISLPIVYNKYGDHDPKDVYKRQGRLLENV